MAAEPGAEIRRRGDAETGRWEMGDGRLWEINHFPFSISHFSFGNFSESHFVMLRVVLWIVCLARDQTIHEINTTEHQQEFLHCQNDKMRNGNGNGKWKMENDLTSPEE